MKEPDELCISCCKVDFFSLFTGPRYSPGDSVNDRVVISLGTLAEVYANFNCPFCRLLKHIVYEDSSQPTQLKYASNHSFLRVKVSTFRTDFYEELNYINKKTRDMVATRLRVHTYAMEGYTGVVPEGFLKCGATPAEPYNSGIQLLSPDYVDPARPLLNGYLATTMSNNLDLLKKWMNTCIESHTTTSEGIRGTCCRTYSPDTNFKDEIKLIDVESRMILRRDPTMNDYAALSYVWGRWGRVQQHQELDVDDTRRSPSALPSKLPKIIDNAITVCKSLSIPYLWVDCYCIDQQNPVELEKETQLMGYRYHYAKITLIGGAFTLASLSVSADVGLLPSDDIENLQRVETIQGRKYITTLPSISDQIARSFWCRRAWTMQEGQLSIRCAFFGKWDISFLCRSGHWRESLHSGKYAHEATLIPGIDLSCKGRNVLSWLYWLNETSWNFEDYHNLIMSYTSRRLTYGSDRIKAIAGALNLLSEKKGVRFIHGLPTADFHYALLWIGECDQPRIGFPSWSWAGWHCIEQYHAIYPKESSTCSLSEPGRWLWESADDRAGQSKYRTTWSSSGHGGEVG